MKKFGSLLLAAVLVLTMLCSCHTDQPSPQPIEKTLGVSVSDIKNLLFFENIDFKTKHSNSEYTICSGVFNEYGGNIEIELHYENSTQEVFKISMWGDPVDEDDGPDYLRGLEYLYLDDPQAFVDGLSDLYLDYVTLLNVLLPVLDASIPDTEEKQLYDMLEPLDEERKIRHFDCYILNDICYTMSQAGEYGCEIEPAK